MAEITAEICRDAILVYGDGVSTGHKLLVALAKAWLDHEAQVASLQENQQKIADVVTGQYERAEKAETTVTGLRAQKRMLEEENVSIKAELATLRQQVASLEKLLHDLTPMGSEFVGRPEKCATWIENHISGLTNMLVAAKGEANELRHTIDDAVLSEGQHKAHIAILEQQLAEARTEIDKLGKIISSYIRKGFECIDVDLVLARKELAELRAENERLRAENDELRRAVSHPPSVEKFIDNLAHCLVSAETEIYRLKMELSGNTGDTTPKQEAFGANSLPDALTPQQDAECDCDGRRRWRCPNPPLVCTQQEALSEGRFA